MSAQTSLSWLISLCRSDAQLSELLTTWPNIIQESLTPALTDFRPPQQVIELAVWLAALTPKPAVMLSQLESLADEIQLQLWFEEARAALARDPEPPIDWVARALRHLPHWLETGLTPFAGYYSLRRLHFLTRGRSSRLIALVHQALCPPEFSAQEAGLQQVRTESVTVLPERIDPVIVTEIQDFARNTPCYPSLADVQHRDPITGEYTLPKVLFDPNAPLAHRYDFHFAEIWNCEAIQKLVADERWPLLAETYLGCRAQLAMTYLWWSTAFDGPQSRYTGQVFHVDVDRFHFVNFFFYLTDVDSSCGAQRYVRGSHREMPLELALDKRWTDPELESYFPGERFKDIQAPAGSVIMADTLALHKGRTLERGTRLMFQLEYAASTLGENTPLIPRPQRIMPELAQALQQAPWRYPKLDSWKS